VASEAAEERGRLLIVAGAGASFDSVPEPGWSKEQRNNEELRPPLAAELFEARAHHLQSLAKFRDCAPMVAELRNATSVEDAIEALVTYRQSGHEQTARQLMALRYYISNVVLNSTETWRTMAQGATNYAALINKVERWRARTGDRVEIVTFNYDTMIEAALTRVAGASFDRMDDYGFGDAYGVFKLHGSVNWDRIVDAGPDALPKDLIQNAPSVRLHDTFVLTARSQGLATIPAIAIPTRTKSSFECPEEHVRLLRQQLSTVDRILVIGWRAQERTFLEMCGEVLPEGAVGLVVDEERTESEQVAEVLQAAIPQGTFVGAGQRGFSGFVAADDLLTALLVNRLNR
jgi:hypothetical protein